MKMRPRPLGIDQLVKLAPVLITLLLTCGCTKLNSQKLPAFQAAPPLSSLGRLYIANSGQGDLLVFNQAVRAVGNLPPDELISTGNVGAIGLFLDSTHDRLYAADVQQNAIRILEGASRMTSVTSPSACAASGALIAPCVRTISGSQTQLNRPFGVFVDVAADRLYVSNTNIGTTCFATNAAGLVPACQALQIQSVKPGFVLVFDDVSGLSGNVAPSRSLSGSASTLDYPRALSVDTAHDLLYVSNMEHNSIVVFSNASTLNGDQVAPFKIIEPPTPRTEDQTCSQSLSCLSNPFGIFLDQANDRLYVANTGLNQPSILIFEHASTRSANAPPERVLTGDITRIADPVGVTLDAEGTLYVANQGVVSSRVLLVASGQSTGSNSANTFNDANASYIPNQFVGLTLRLNGGTGAGQSGTIVSNTSTQFTIAGTWSELPDSTTLYQVTQQTQVSAPPLESVVVFHNFDNRCKTSALGGCGLQPDQFIQGDATLLADPAGVAVDAEKGLVYVAEGTGNTITMYGLTGNISPSQINESGKLPTTGLNPTQLDAPAGIFYDAPHDRLFVANYNGSIEVIAPTNQNEGAILVWENVSQTAFAQTPPTWWIDGGGSLIRPEGVFVDDTRNQLIVLSQGPFGIGNLTSFDLLPTLLPNPPPAGGSQVLPTLWSVAGLSSPLALAADPSRGRVYVSFDDPFDDIQIFSSLDGTAVNSVPITSSNAAFPISRPFGLAVDPTRDILYISNLSRQSILGFQGASTLNGPISPNLILSGSATQISLPEAIAVDPSADRLFVTNTGNQSIVTFNHISTTLSSSSSGAINLTPTGIIQGPLTGLNYIPSTGTSANFNGIYVDSSSGETIYTAEPFLASDSNCPAAGTPFCGAFLVFGLKGNIAPSAVIGESSGSFGVVAGNLAEAVDGKRDILYIANRGGDSASDDQVFALTGASSAGVASTPRLILCSPQATSSPCPNTGLNNPQGIALDPVNDRLYIANGAAGGGAGTLPNTILVFNQASLLSGNTSPSCTFSDPQLNDPKGLALDSADNELFVANSGGGNILVFPAGCSSATTVTSASTTLTDPSLAGVTGVAVDPDKGILYAAVGKQSPPGQAATLGNIVIFNNQDKPTLIFGQAPQNPDLSPSYFTFNNPSAIFLDTVNNILYVTDADQNALYVFEDADRINAGTLPSRVLAGPVTTLGQPSGVAVDASH